MYSLRGKPGTGTFNVGRKAFAGVEERLGKGSGSLRASPHSDKLPTYEKKMPKDTSY